MIKMIATTYRRPTIKLLVGTKNEMNDIKPRQEITIFNEYRTAGP
jgi:hypothetical protein